MLLNLVLVQFGYALESDRYAAIDIQANRAVLSELNGLAVYSGQVQLSQGSLRINCDTLTVHTQNGAVSKVEATGTPARYQQQLDSNQPNVQAEALAIVYFPADEKVLLKRSAKLFQSNNVFEGDHMEYDLRQQRLSASHTSDEAQDALTTKRVRMTLQPQSTPTADVHKTP